MRNRQIADLPATMAAFPDACNKLSVQAGDLTVHEVKYLHFHREFELGMCVSGSGILFHGDEEQPFSEGDVQIVYPYMRHIHRTPDGERCRWIWIYIDEEKLLAELGIRDFSRTCELIRRTSVISGLVDSSKMPELHRRLSDFTKRCGGEGFPDILHMALDFYGILLSASDSLPNGSGEEAELADISALEPALRRITEDMENGMSTSVEQLSRLCSMSVSGFRRRFSSLMGASPKVYIQACRIRRAKQLLRQGEMNILNIAFSVGYKDISGFNRSFREITGEMPSAYRKRHR